MSRQQHQIEDGIEKQAVRERLRLAKKHKTYTQLVNEYGVNRKELHKIIKRDDYNPPAWVWLKLGVHVFELAPVCPVHGKACVLDCTTERKVKKVTKPRGTLKKYERVAIRKDNPDSAVRTMKKHIPQEVLTKIVTKLLADGLEMEY